MSLSPQLVSVPGKYAVVQLAERKFPGVLIQGDSLNNLVQQTKRGLSLLKLGKIDVAVEELQDASCQLSEALEFLEKICAANGISMPYAFEDPNSAKPV